MSEQMNHEAFGEHNTKLSLPVKRSKIGLNLVAVNGGPRLNQVSKKRTQGHCTERLRSRQMWLYGHTQVDHSHVSHLAEKLFEPCLEYAYMSVCLCINDTG